MRYSYLLVILSTLECIRSRKVWRQLISMVVKYHPNKNICTKTIPPKA